jgi:hypothetical protein
MKNSKPTALVATLAALVFLTGFPSTVDGATPEAGRPIASLAPLRDARFSGMPPSPLPVLDTALDTTFRPSMLNLTLPAAAGEVSVPLARRRIQLEALSLLVLGAGLIWGSSQGRRRLSRAKRLKNHAHESIPRYWRKTLQH